MKNLTKQNDELTVRTLIPNILYVLAVLVILGFLGQSIASFLM